MTSVVLPNGDPTTRAAPSGAGAGSGLPIGELPQDCAQKDAPMLLPLFSRRAVASRRMFFPYPSGESLIASRCPSGVLDNSDQSPGAGSNASSSPDDLDDNTAFHLDPDLLDQASVSNSAAATGKDWSMLAPPTYQGSPTGALAMNRGPRTLGGTTEGYLVSPSMGINPFNNSNQIEGEDTFGFDDGEDDLFCTAGLDAPFDGAAAVRKLQSNQHRHSAGPGFLVTSSDAAALSRTTSDSNAEMARRRTVHGAGGVKATSFGDGNPSSANHHHHHHHHHKEIASGEKKGKTRRLFKRLFSKQASLGSVSTTGASLSPLSEPPKRKNPIAKNP